MISVIIPTLQSRQYIAKILVSLMPAVMNGLVREVIVSDGGSSDETFQICDEMGAVFVRGSSGRGSQLARGAKAAKGEWLLFLHVDTVLGAGWEEAVAAFVSPVILPEKEQAAYFRFSLDTEGLRPSIVEWAVNLRCRILGLPYGDQGLLISRAFYDEVGGYGALPIMEDVDLVRKIGAARLVQLEVAAITSPCRYQEYGYLLRVSRNFLCIMMYFSGVSPGRIQHFYQGKPVGAMPEKKGEKSGGNK